MIGAARVNWVIAAGASTYLGEYERAFCGDQRITMVPIFQQHGVQLWLPEVDGPVSLDDPAHLALMRLLGVQSKREVLRARFRVLAAMRAQARIQGRHLGGRPPYGYRLGDAGPHPTGSHASWGRRLHKLEADPATAPQVRWMFAQRLAGPSFAGIARRLNDNRVLCPSGVDRDRNRHRKGEAWTVQSVAAILTNPRYTGRQVWNRQRTDRDPIGSPQCRWVQSTRIRDLIHTIRSQDRHHLGPLNDHDRSLP